MDYNATTFSAGENDLPVGTECATGNCVFDLWELRDKRITQVVVDVHLILREDGKEVRKG